MNVAPTLMPGETTVLVVRRNPRVIVAAVIAAAVCVVAGLYWIERAPGFLQALGYPGAPLKSAARLVLLVAVAATLRVQAGRWWRLMYVITDRRVIVQSGVVRRRIQSIPDDSIQDVVVHRDPLAEMLAAGHVEISSAGHQTGTERLALVPHAEAFAALLGAREESLNRMRRR